MNQNSAELLILVGQALYGERWQTELARDLGLSDGRRVRQWLAGDRNVPSGVWTDLEKLLTERQVCMEQALDALRSR